MTTPSGVVHRERIPIRDRKGNIEIVHEFERAETPEESARQQEALRDSLKHQAAAMREDLRRVTAERDALRATVADDHGRKVTLELFLHTERNRSAGLERDLALLVDAQQKAILARDGQDAAFLEAVALVARQVQQAVSQGVYELPADLVDLAALALLERELREIAAAEDPPRQLPEQLHWVLPSDEEAS